MSKKIALLLSGLPRMWQLCLPSQIALFEQNNYDIYFHFWDTIETSEKQQIVDLLKPRAYKFEAPKDFSKFDNDPRIKRDTINIPSRLFSQYYSWAAVGELFEPFKSDYDLAIRSRADLQFVYGISHIFPNLGPNDILLSWWDEKKLLSDIFAIGGVEPILYYHRLFNQVESYAAKRELNAELMLTTHFEQRPDIHILTDQFQYYFVRRPHMSHYTIEQAMLENPGRNKWLDPEVFEAHKNFHQTTNGLLGATYIEQFRHAQINQLNEEIKQKGKDKK